MSNAERLIEVMEIGFAGGDLEIDAAAIDAMIAALAPITDDGIVMVMQGPDGKFVATYEGFEGLREGWNDWRAAFDRLRFTLGGLETIGQNVLMVGSQIGTTRHGGVEIEQPSAVVWKFRDGLVHRVEFHLDREQAAESAAES